jgi:plasmid stabilization system protein ParE
MCQKPPPLAVNLRPMSKSEPFGPNTACESSLYPSGSCRLQRDTRLHCRSFPAGREAGQARIQSIIDLLLLYPFIGARTDDPTMRRLPASPYPFLVFYEVTESEIIVHAVRHAARDSSDMPGSA